MRDFGGGEQVGDGMLSEPTRLENAVGVEWNVRGLECTEVIQQQTVELVGSRGRGRWQRDAANCLALKVRSMK